MISDHSRTLRLHPLAAVSVSQNLPFAGSLLTSCSVKTHAQYELKQLYRSLMEVQSASVTQLVLAGLGSHEAMTPSCESAVDPISATER